MYRTRLKENKAVSAADFNAAQDRTLVNAALAWVQQAAASPSGSVPTGPSIELFRYTTCPFCGKAKAFLDYYRIPHELVEVEPMFKNQLAPCAYKKLPVLRLGGVGGAFLVDSDEIVDTLAEKVGIGAQLRDPDVVKWRRWARESLVRHVTLNVNRSLSEAWLGYEYIDGFDTIPLANKIFLKVVGAPVMYMVARLKTRPTLIKAGELQEGQDERAVLRAQMNSYIDDVGISERRPFHGGAKPDLADLDVYGVLQSVRGHEVYNDLLGSTKVAPWLDQMDKELGKEAYAPRSRP